MSASDTFNTALTRLANDRRRSISQYANIEALAGQRQPPPRLISDLGFLQDAQFAYYAPNAAHVTRHDERRDITQVVLVPYGIKDDANRLKRRAGHNTIRTTRRSTSSGVTPYPSAPDEYLMSAAMDAETVAPQKTSRLLASMGTRSGGPAYHFVIDRRGNITTCVPLDDETSAYEATSSNNITVAMESALVIQRSQYNARDFSQLIELPFTTVQMLTLAILLRKIITALPNTPTRFVSLGSDGISYGWELGGSGTDQYNFAESAPANPFDFTKSSREGLLATMAEMAPFDLATEVFRTEGAPPAVAARTQARTAISSIDTVGERSVLLGQYATLAAADRANDMQGAPRSQIFVQRIRVAHQEADDAASGASTASDLGAATSGIPTTVAGAEPHTYNYSTGLWGDGRSY